MPSGISDTGIEAAEFERRLPEMVDRALRDGCTPTNPRAPDANTLTELLSPGSVRSSRTGATDNKIWRTLPMAHYSLTPRVKVLADRFTLAGKHPVHRARRDPQRAG